MKNNKILHLFYFQYADVYREQNNIALLKILS